MKNNKILALHVSSSKNISMFINGEPHRETIFFTNKKPQQASLDSTSTSNKACLFNINNK